MITALLRRIRFSAGSLALLAALAFVATLLITAAPRLANEYADRGLRERIDAAGYQVRDLGFVLRPDPDRPDPRPVEVQARTTALERSLRPELRAVVEHGWSAIQAGPDGLAAVGDLGGVPLRLGLRWQSDAVESVELVEGSWPQPYLIAGAPVEAAMSEAVADGLGLKVGTTFTAVAADNAQVDVVIVGIFRPIDPTAPIWATEPEVVTPFTPIGEDGVPWSGVLLTHESSMANAMSQGISTTYSWRFRIDETRVTTADLDPLVAAVIAARQTAGAEAGVAAAAPQTGLDGMLSRFASELRGVGSILAVVQAGVLATVFGLALLAARSVVERRRTEIALLRARGGSAMALGTRLAIEVSLVVPVAVLGAWLLGRNVPGRPGSADWLAILLGLAAVLAVPVIAGVTQRRATFVADAEMARPKRSIRRVTAELFVLVLAGLGVVLLQRRGLTPGNGVDPYLVSVPVLLGTGAALLALRLLPWPLRQVGRVTGRARGAVAFLGFARAGRTAPAGAAPLAVLVVAVSTGIFSAVVATTIDDGRNRATDRAVPGDAIVEGFLFTPTTAQSLAGVGGVTTVATLSRNPASTLITGLEVDARELTQVYAVAADGPALASVMAARGVTGELPAEFVTASVTSGPVPAVVSSDVAADVGSSGAVDVQGKVYAFRVSTVVDSFPGVPFGASRFVVLPLQALDQPATKPVLPTAFVVAGAGLDLDGLRRVGDDGQREWEEQVTGVPRAEIDSPTTAATWAQRRAELEGSGVNQVLGFAFAVGAAGGSVLALLAVGFAVVAGARSRGRTLSRLRTMGLSRRQGNRLLAYELLPVLSVGALAGVAVGVALPSLLAPVLDLTSFTGGAPARPQLDPVVAAAVAALVAVGMVAALVLEQLVNRRLRVGDVLRLGEEIS